MPRKNNNQNNRGRGDGGNRGRGRGRGRGQGRGRGRGWGRPDGVPTTIAPAMAAATLRHPYPHTSADVDVVIQQWPEPSSVSGASRMVVRVHPYFPRGDL